MSKMGRYVFDLQETADADSDRKAHPNSQADEDSRLAAGGMEIGDSFLAPINASEETEVRALRQRVSRWQRGTTSRFSVVRDGESMRVFRVL